MTILKSKALIIGVLSLAGISTYVFIAENIQEETLSTVPAFQQPLRTKIEKEIDEGSNTLTTRYSSSIIELSDNQIISNIEGNDTLLTIQALSYVWQNIQNFKSNTEILSAALSVGLTHEDIRVSGLAGLIVTMESPVKILEELASKQKSISTGAPTSTGESRPTMTNQNQSAVASEVEILNEQSSQTYSEIATNGSVSNMRTILERRDAEQLQKLTDTIRENEQPVQLVITDELISFLKQGIGDSQQVVNILAENSEYLSSQQINEIRSLLSK